MTIVEIRNHSVPCFSRIGGSLRISHQLQPPVQIFISDVGANAEQNSSVIIERPIEEERNLQRRVGTRPFHEPNYQKNSVTMRGQTDTRSNEIDVLMSNYDSTILPENRRIYCANAHMQQHLDYALQCLREIERSLLSRNPNTVSVDQKCGNVPMNQIQR